MRGAGALAALLLAWPSAATDAAALARGEQLYGRCAGCHAIEQHRTGPAHCGLFGRLSGTAKGFDGYTKAMREARIVWADATLDGFLADPMKRVPGTSMTYSGIGDAAERKDLIAWLKQATRPGTRCTLP